MLVLCVGMYRACSTWQYGVAGLLLERHRGGQRLGFVEGIHLAEKVDARRWADDWAVLKAHDAHGAFGSLLATRRAIGFYAHRDLRDVVASYMHKTGTSFETLMEHGFVERCLRNDRYWRARPGVLVQRYDDLIADPAAGVAQIAVHLGIDLDAGEAEAIAASLSKEANRRQVETMTARLVEQGATLAATDQSHFDPVSLLHWNHIRPTRAGAEPGLDLADRRHRRQIERVGGPWLVANGYDPIADAVVHDEPILRTATAPGGVDVRLDRLWRGVVATAVDFDAPHPRVANPSYFLYRRGWRTINVGTTPAPRDRFGLERPSDLNLACQPDADRPEAAPGASLRDLLESRPIDPPALVAINAAADAAAILGVVWSLGWRPEVVVIVPSRAGAASTPGRADLEGRGYLAVPIEMGPAIYLRGDLADSLSLLSRPLGPEDRYVEANWGAEFAALELRLDQVPVDLVPAPVPPQPNLGDGWQGERDMFQGERDAWQRERDAWQRERDQVQRERDAWQRERDQVQRDRLGPTIPVPHPRWQAARRRLAPVKRLIRDLLRPAATPSARPPQHRVDGPHRS